MDTWTLGVVLTARDYLTSKFHEAEAAVKRLRNVTDQEVAAIRQQLESIKTWGTVGMVATEIGRRGIGFLRDANQANIEIAAGVGNLASVVTDSSGQMTIDLELARRKAFELAAEYRGGAADMLEIQYQLVSAGREAEQVIGNEATVVAQTSQAIRGETSETAGLLATMANNLTGSFEHMGDVVASTVQKHQIIGPQFAEAMKYGVPAANTLGWAVEELAANIGALHDAGLKGGMAGTALMATSRQVLKAEEELGVEFERTADGGISLASVLETLADEYTVNGERVERYSELTDEAKRSLQEAFGDEGLRAISFLWGQEEALRAEARALEATAGSAEIMAGAMGGFADLKWENIGDQWQQLKADLMESNPILEAFAGLIGEILDALNNAPDWVKDVIGVVIAGGSVAGAVGGPLMTLYQGLKLRGIMKTLKAGDTGTGGGATPATTGAAGAGGTGITAGAVIGSIAAVGALTLGIREAVLSIQEADVRMAEARTERASAQVELAQQELEAAAAAGASEAELREKAAELEAARREEIDARTHEATEKIDLAADRLIDGIEGMSRMGQLFGPEWTDALEYLRANEARIRSGDVSGVSEALAGFGIEGARVEELLGEVVGARVAGGQASSTWSSAQEIASELMANTGLSVPTDPGALASPASRAVYHVQKDQYEKALESIRSAAQTAAKYEIDVTGLNPLEEGFLQQLAKRIQEVMNRENEARSNADLAGKGVGG
jgi:TP901 family phage tail tape measure protein